ncbi:MAG TPA: MFS transporter [Actinomycetes bacterium]|nr:MFS transporter [Actinomycetes bacterium]
MSTGTQARDTLSTRVRPLYIAAFLLGIWLWVPVEKLFMTEIGFTAAAVGVMAAVYSAVPPIMEIPSGVLADRWSRRGVLIVASVAGMLSVLVGGLSTNVPTYFLSAFFLGIFFAMRSGTVEAVIYDLVLEETGSSDEYETRVGRVRLIESSALVSSALVGGLLANLTSLRLTYFLTIPFTGLAIIALLRFREPTLHKAEEATSLRAHLAVTYQAVSRPGQLRSIIVLAVMTGLILTTIFEFGPLWLVAIAAPAILYGPHWAGLMSTFGLGGLLAGRLRFDRPLTIGGVAAVMAVASWTLTSSRNVVGLTVAQIVLALLGVAASIHISRLMHDAVPSSVRAGVASAVGALSWVTFLPFALGFGVVSEYHGVHTAGWMIVAATVITGIMLVKVALANCPPAPAPRLAALRGGCTAEGTA